MRSVDITLLMVPFLMVSQFATLPLVVALLKVKRTNAWFVFIFRYSTIFSQHIDGRTHSFFHTVSRHLYYSAYCH